MFSKISALFAALLVTLFVSLPAEIVHAQTAPTATLTWVAPTTYTDGTSIPSSVAITYNIYQGTSATTLVKVATGVTTLTNTISTGLSDGVTYFWAVTAVANGVEGAQSNVGSKVFAPGTPGTVTLTVK